MKWAAVLRCIAGIYGDRAVARISGLELRTYNPGAYAPGFMPTPAPQAKPGRFGQPKG